MVIKKQQEKLLVLLLAFACTVGIVLFLHHNLDVKKKSHYAEQQAILDTAFRASIQMYRLAMESFFYNSLSTPQVLALFAQAVDSAGSDRDLARGKLYRHLYGAYESLKRQNLLQLHFHLSDGTSFLRFHQPDRYGDSLFETRPGIKICNTEKRIVQGLESASTRSSFRYVFPLIYQDRHLGSVEVGVTVKAILDSLKELDPEREYAFVLNRNLAESILFPEQQWLYSPSALHGEYLVEDANSVLPESPSSLSPNAQFLNVQLHARPDVQLAMHAGKGFAVSESLGKTMYTVSLLPLQDVSNRFSGYLVTYAPDTIISNFHQEYYLLLIYALSALGVIFGLVWRLHTRSSALDAERQSLKTITHTLAEGVYAVDLSGMITMVNPAACQILGFTEGEMLGQEAHSLFHKHQHSEVLEKDACPFGGTLTTGVPYDGEDVFITKAGKLLQVEVASRAMIQEEGRRGAVIAFHDITERKQIIESLRLSELRGRKLSTAVEQSPASVVITDVHGNIEYVNEKFSRTSGYSAEEVIGQSHNILQSQLMPGSLYKTIWHTISAGYEWKGELQSERKDGTAFWEYVSISPIRNKSDEITHFIAIKEDLTERLQMKEMLKDNEMIQRILLESLPVGLAIIDAGTRVIEQINPYAAALYGAAAEQIIGNRCHNFLCPAEECACPIIDLGQTVDNSDRIMIRADGSELPVLKTVKKITVRGNTKLLECFVDISARKKGEDALREANTQLELAIDQAEKFAREAEAANQAKSSFLANMSHEIRTPMNSVLGMMHLALQTDLSAQQRDFLAKAEYSAKSLLGILNEILDLSKIEAGRLELEQVEFNLHDVLDNVGAVISSRLHNKAIEFNIIVYHDVPIMLVGDPLRLGQILINLAGNAAKFTAAGEIRITVRRQAETSPDEVRLEFEVIDTGMGIETERIDDLFDPFTQADASTTRQYGGTGLGLTITQRLVRLMGGAIHVTSALGEGSSFVFDAMFHVSGNNVLSPACSSANISPQKILIVDDQESAQTSLQEYLRAHGIEPYLAASDNEARSMLREAAARNEPFDIVFFDEFLPGAGSAVFSQTVDNDPAIRPTPQLVLVLASQQHEIRPEAGQGRVSASIQKPLSFGRLKVILHELVAEAGPFYTEHQGAGSASALAPVRSHFENTRALLVEDNEFNRLVAENVLANIGLQVTVAENGQEAVALAASNQFDVIIMDILMPVMDGMQATERIRQLPGYRNLPIIAMTASATLEERERIVKAGMDEHIAKPIDVGTLISALNRWLKPASGKTELSSFPPQSTPSSAQCAPSAEAVAALDQLIVALRSCKPKQCKIAAGQLVALLRTNDCKAAVNKIETLVEQYEFGQAQALAQSLREEMPAKGDGR